MLEFLFGLVEVFGDGALNAIGGVIGWVVGWIAQGILIMAAGLPENILEYPQVTAQVETGLAWLNWFVPLSGIVQLLTVWVVATTTFYGARFVFRVLYDNIGSWFTK